MAALLPVLVADLLEESAREFLEGVARENEEVWVPLVAAPVDTSRHLLEVYTPGAAHPLRLLAEPMGPPTEQGFPLRLSLLSDEELAALQAPAVERVDVVDDVTIEPALEPAVPGRVSRRASTASRVAGTARTRAPLRLSDEHTAELAGDPAPLSAAARDALVGRTLAGGRLQIESLVGRGTMGSVYKAVHRDLGIRVAVKVLHESYQRDVEFCRRFYAEALAASGLDHPNLVRVHDFGQEPDGLLYLSMEFIEGRTLREVLQVEGPMTARRIADLVMQVCAGLGHAHERGIVHRDIKPDNIVLVMRRDDDGRPFEQVKVCDFGLALLRASDSVNERFAGTPVYMSPEQCRGEELDPLTDVYACGIMIYELATGSPPFLSDKPIVVVNRHLSRPPPPLASVRADIDPRLEPIVQKALKKLRADRYPSVRLLREDLKALRSPLRAAVDPADETAQPKSAPPSGESPPAGVRTSSAPPQAGMSSRPPAAQPARTSSMPPAAARTSSMPPAGDTRRHSAPPAWFEDKMDSYSNFLQGMASGEKRAAEVLGSLTRDPKMWLTKLLEERDPRVVETMLDEVEGAARVLARQADARTLRAVSSTIHGIATDESRPQAVRVRAAAVLRLFGDPTLLAPIAERLLLRNDDQREAARTVILDAGVAGAYALYGARVKSAAEPSAREPFVATMRVVGEAAWPVVRAALERIPAAALTGEHPLAADLAEDLLLCVPVLRDEAAGHLVAKYLQATGASLCRAATLALGRLWAERAAPLLLALLEAPDDGVRAAAIAGLREIGAVDPHVVRRLLPILGGMAAAGQQLRLAAVSALEFVTADARPVAVPVLVQLVRDNATDAPTVYAAARALLSVMGNEARAVVIGRSDRASEPLKSHLLVLLRDPKLPEVDPKELKELM